jgi:signal transduction histidine kinase/ActR/RegA family two-component response regulator
MWAFLQSLLDSSTLSPHGICLLWRPDLIWLHVVSDAIIALAYFSIPFAISVFVWKRPDIQFSWVFWAFAIFIMACGMTHVMAIWTLWVPDYAFEGLIKAITAAASIVTAIMLWPLLPKALALPSPAQMMAAQDALKREAQERRQAEDMLRQSQRLDAVGHLTGGVAHDFNNLLTVIMGNLEIAQRNIGSGRDGAGDRVHRVLDNAMGGAQRAATLTQRLLAFARRQPLNPKPLNPSKLVTGMSDFFHRTLGENIQVDIAGSADVWQVEADHGELEAALLNLVVNARDAMDDGGKLTIATGNACLDDDYCARHVDVYPGQYVVIAVTDTGHGMTNEVRERAFEPFFTTKTVGQGTGLGLSQVYGFIKQSGGHVKIESTVGKGTTVRIYLPRLPRAGADEDADTVTVAGSHTGETIFVVEDDPDVRSYVVETLSDLKYNVIQAGDAEAAIKALEDQKVEVDLLLTDVILPGQNGRQLADQLKKLRPSLKVLLMTGYSRNTIVHQGRLDAGVDLIQKPLTRATLASRIRSLMDAVETTAPEVAPV